MIQSASHCARFTRHSRAGGNPVRYARAMDTGLRGDDAGIRSVLQKDLPNCHSRAGGNPVRYARAMDTGLRRDDAGIRSVLHKDLPKCHSRAGGNPVLYASAMDPRLRGDDAWCGEEVVHRSPQEIMEEIASLDLESAEVLQTIRGLL